MPWTDITRRQYACEAARYARDLSDGEWGLIASLLPGPKPVGRPRFSNLREVVNAILYMASTGCQWRMLPKEFPPFTTVQNYFYAWRDAGVLRAINNTLVMDARELEGREASLSAGVIDSQSVKDQAETSVPFELISARYERRSMLITANQPFGEWGNSFQTLP